MLGRLLARIIRRRSEVPGVEYALLDTARALHPHTLLCAGCGERRVMPRTGWVCADCAKLDELARTDSGVRA